MLSHISTLILGIIAEKPVNPYEIKKLLEKIEIRKWMPMSAASIYLTVRELNKKGYCEGRPSREGNMPEKTIYSATEKGKAALRESLVEYLGSADLDRKKYQISVLLLCHLSKEDAIEILTRKIEKLEKITCYLGCTLDNMQNKVPYTGLSMVTHELAFVKAEIIAVKELLEGIHQDEHWNHFITGDFVLPSS